MKSSAKAKLSGLMGIGVLLFAGTSAYAAPDTTLNLGVTNGTLTADIVDSSGGSVTDPSVSMTSAVSSAACKGAGSLSGEASMGTLGTNDQRIKVDNPGVADAGWTLSIAATDGPTALWQPSATLDPPTMDYNDSDATDGDLNKRGCSDHTDVDSAVGGLLVKRSSAALTTSCSGCTTNGISVPGTNTFFQEGSQDSITLIDASDTSEDVWSGYLTNVGLEQSIPGGQEAAQYELGLTITVVAK